MTKKIIIIVLLINALFCTTVHAKEELVTLYIYPSGMEWMGGSTYDPYYSGRYEYRPAYHTSYSRNTSYDAMYGTFSKYSDPDVIDLSKIVSVTAGGSRGRSGWGETSYVQLYSSTGTCLATIYAGNTWTKPEGTTYTGYGRLYWYVYSTAGATFSRSAVVIRQNTGPSLTGDLSDGMAIYYRSLPD